MRPLSSGNRRGKADDSIIRGAAIIRDHIHRLTDSFESDDQPLVSETSGSGSNSKASHAVDEEDNFSDPWVTKGPLIRKNPPRVVSPVNKHDDETFGFDSLSGNGTFNSSGQPVEWANRAMSEDNSVALSVRSRQPDTDSCDPLSPQRPKKKDLGVTQVTTYNLVGPIASIDDSDDKLGYSFVDDEDEDDGIGGEHSYLPRDMRENSNLVSARNNNRRKSGGRKARILQLVTSNGDSPNSSPGSQQERARRKRNQLGSTSDDGMDQVVSPTSVEYSMLLQDPAFRHAQKAGLLWQSLVGSQIRFPSSWWNGARSPPMSLDGRKRQWQFFGRYPCFNSNLRRYVKHRSSPGRLLLHIVVQDLVTWKPVQDIVVGCFDPNSRGIRRTSQAEPGKEDCRELWLAVRKRSETISVIDSLLAQGRSWLDCECKGPLGPDQRITNSNVRSVFGEAPPVETIFIHESTLYERLVAGKDQGPPIFLVREFVFC
eukprot:CAMPEP_0172476064 /NCGR_PEP_ID=MMETSP1065-20121228/70189_1 /TAXON_ID=265537 /ORGANISM="Amphiprora paludosa, Strain CCMP125" /LENGTH=484 /DNA_ID=CAMNT_0013234279 /DNA_START=406 /DNA_END=1860 /DNA_ORIENTATION=+